MVSVLCHYENNMDQAYYYYLNDLKEDKKGR
jgi:hypothetical protein